MKIARLLFLSQNLPLWRSALRLWCLSRQCHEHYRRIDAHHQMKVIGQQAISEGIQV